MRSSYNSQGSIIFRSKKNAHRLFYFLNGTLKSFLTHEKDVLANVAELFGALNPLSYSKKATTAAFAVVATLGLLAQAPSFSLPQGGQSVSGDVTFNQNGNTLDVNTNASRSIANYNSFNVANGETVNFNLPGASSAILNRVIGGNPSQIFGAINSNGQVFLVNPSGILFGSTAQVNVGSLFASTLNITDQNFLNGNLVFNRDPNSNASVENQGMINITKGGFAVLTGSSVANSGTIMAPSGQVHLAVGDQVTLNLGNGISADVTVDKALQSKVAGVQDAINNSGLIKADGGLVKLQANLQDSIYDRLINNTGRIEVLSVKDTNGVISFVGTVQNQTAIAKTVNYVDAAQTILDTDILDADGQVINPAVQQDSTSTNTQGLVVNSGFVNASGTVDNANGGKISIQGGNVVQNGTLLAESANGGKGGTITLQSLQDTTLNSGSLTSVKGNGTGSAGSVKITATHNAYFNDSAVINAQGGEVSGNGGNVEVSGLNRTQYLGLTRLGATNGQVGNLLIDPTNFKFSTDASATLLNTSGNVNVWASRDILVDAAANFLNVGAGSVLSLNAGRHITITKALTTNGGNMSLNANTDTTAYGGGPASGTGNFTLAPTGSINTNGGGVALTGYDVNVQSTLNAGKYITANAARNVFVNQTGNITGLNGTNINLVAASANRMYGNLTTSNANVNLTAYASGVGDITGGLDIGSNSIYTANLSATGNSTVSLNGKLVSIYGTVNAGKSLNINALRQVTFNKANVAVNPFGRINVAGGTGVVVAGSNLTANNGIITINADSTGTGVGFFQNTVNSNINAGYGIVLIEGGNNLQQGANINAGLIGLFASAANSQIVFTPGSSTVAPLIGVYAVNGSNSSILVNGNVSGTGCLSAAEFIASGNISGAGRITTTALKLESFNGSIGTSATSRLGINTRLLNANAKNGDVYLNVYGGSVDLIGINRAKGKFFVQAIDPGKVRTFFGLVIAPSIQLVSK